MIYRFNTEVIGVARRLAKSQNIENNMDKSTRMLHWLLVMEYDNDLIIRKRHTYVTNLHPVNTPPDLYRPGKSVWGTIKNAGYIKRIFHIYATPQEMNIISHEGNFLVSEGYILRSNHDQLWKNVTLWPLGWRSNSLQRSANWTTETVAECMASVITIELVSKQIYSVPFHGIGEVKLKVAFMYTQESYQ